MLNSESHGYDLQLDLNQYLNLFNAKVNSGMYTSASEVISESLLKKKINNKIYIGQSINIKIRYASHMRSLRNKNHPNSHLSRSFHKYGEDSFELMILEICDEKYLTQKEQNWIDKHNKNELYNEVLNVTQGANKKISRQDEIVENRCI